MAKIQTVTFVDDLDGKELDPDDQHTGGHRIQGAGVTDLAGAEEPSAARNDIMTGHTARLVDDDKPGGNPCTH